VADAYASVTWHLRRLLELPFIGDRQVNAVGNDFACCVSRKAAKAQRNRQLMAKPTIET
jgi:hypothetical protein